MAARIAQISDLHISVDGSHPRGIDVRGSFEQVVAEISRVGYDLLVLSGDLVATRGHENAYEWIFGQTEKMSVPVLVMAGNHDDSRRIATDLDIERDLIDGCLCGTHRLDGVTVYALDTSSGVLPESQIAWLERCIQDDDQPPLVFMHHPPLDCGCRFMDRYMPLRNGAEVWPRLARIPGLHTIFCCNYHTHKVLVRDGVSVVLCPSTELQIAQESEGFEIEHLQPGFLDIRASAQSVSWTACDLERPARASASVEDRSSAGPA